jgi:hypothetical protein
VIRRGLIGRCAGVVKRCLFCYYYDFPKKQPN